MGLDNRIGPKFLQAGIGFGGSCFPKDVTALKQLAGNSGYHFQLLNSVIEVNELQKRRVIAKLEKHLGRLVDREIALLGLAFKPNTDDMREASSLVLSSRLQAAGARVRAYDPVAEGEARKLIRGVEFCETPLEAVAGADAVVLVTEWPEFARARPARGRRRDGRQRLVDGRNLFDPDAVRPPGSSTRASAAPRRGRRVSDDDGVQVEAVDSTGQLDEVLGLAEHLRDALWRVDSSGARPVDAPGGLIVAGMGGSAAGARLALARARAAADAAVRGRRRLRAARLGGRRRRSCCCSSYSGATEETLAAYDDAVERGAPRLVVSTGGPLAERARRDGVPVIPVPGGFQPRAAIGYSLVSALEAAALAGAARRCATRSRRPPRSPRSSPSSGARTARRLRAKSIARDAARHRPGDRRRRAGAPRRPTAGSASSTRTRSCRRSRPCCPEADHNEIVGWEAARALGRFSYVSLEDPRAHPRNALRAELTAEFAAAGAAPVVRVRRAASRASSGSCRWCCSATCLDLHARCCAAPIR